MPVNPEDRTTVALGADLIRAVREQAGAEGRGFSAVIADAVNAYLARLPAAPTQALSAPDPARTSVPPAPAGLEAEVRALLGAVRELLPDVRRVADNHDEAMDTLDQLAAEIGRRQGAALALEEAAAIADGRKPGR